MVEDVAKKGAPRLATDESTDTATAFLWARNLLEAELPSLDEMPAPIVCHLTDGEYNGNDPEPIARDIMSMSNPDGNVLVENILIGTGLATASIDPRTWPGLRTDADLTTDHAKKLFAMSSELPESYAACLAADGFAMQRGARMLIPGQTPDLVELAFTMSGSTPTG